MSAVDHHKDKDLLPLQLRNLAIMRHLLEHDAVSEEIIDALRENELDYFSLLDKYELLQQSSNIDPKTNLLRPRSDYLTTIIKTASRFSDSVKYREYPVAFVRFDIDDFSAFNTRYGHSFGDEVLAKVAETIKKSSRPTDYVIRFGGEEFDVILPATRSHDAGPYLDRILDRIRNLELFYENQPVHITISAGLTGTSYRFSTPPFVDATETEALFKHLQDEADDALYEAKATGKNRWCRFDPAKRDLYRSYRQSYKKT